MKRNRKHEKRVFIDMDGTLAEWKNIQLTISSEDGILSVKDRVYEILRQDGYYFHLKPHANMVQAVQMLQKTPGIEVYILTCYIPDCRAQQDKMHWIRTYLPGFPEDHILMVEDGKDKSSVIVDPRWTDILVDDYTKNLVAWHGLCVKAINGVNDTHQSFCGLRVSVDAEPAEIVREIQKRWDVVATRFKKAEKRGLEMLDERLHGGNGRDIRTVFFLTMDAMGRMVFVDGMGDLWKYKNPGIIDMTYHEPLHYARNINQTPVVSVIEENYVIA